MPQPVTRPSCLGQPPAPERSLPRAHAPGGAPKIRPSKSSRRRAIVLIGIHALVAIHVAHWMTSGSSVSPLEPSEAMEFSKRGLVNAGLVFFALTILSTLVLGRFFCGWACHLVALQDLCRWLLKRAGITPKPLRSRLLAFVPVLAFLYMFILPLAHRLWVTKSAAPTGIHLTTESFWATFPAWPIAVLTFAVCGFAIIYFLGSKGFCTYACPYGAIFGVADRFAPGRIRVTDACEGCGHCTAVCTSNVRVHEEVAIYKMVVDPGCMKCLDCVSVCPNHALYFGFGPPSIVAKRSARPRRRAEFTLWEEVTLSAFFVLAFLTYRGLYGQIPFLLSLGIAGILAYVALQAMRVAYAENVFLLRWPIKRGGRLVKGGGYAFLAAVAAIALLSAHSGAIQYHSFQRSRLHERTAAIRHEVYSLVSSPVQLDDAEAALVERATAHGLFVERWGLLLDRENEKELAWLHLLAGDAEKAEPRLRRLLEDMPDNASFRFDFGVFLRSRGRTAEAIESFRDSLRVDPDLVRARLELGHALAAQGRFAEAAAVYDEGIARQPEVAEYHYHRGLVQALQHDLPGAIERFRRALAVRPALAEARRDLGHALCAAGALDEGIAELEEAVTLAPRDVGALQTLGNAYIETKRWDRAESCLLSAVSLAPESAPLHLALSEVYAARGDASRASEHYRKAVEIDPSLLPRAR
jgi:tetratricopeptide (TPR) repeat protein/polyferredoxin